ncbi:phospho-sugar mutase [Akkermansiaceae bacterium]|nr:phospho-sugar mutase [Akkermansiaceae bacterium]MDB4570213.1 phospho-sugar mutase [Akkermansiaceae bacterium]
MDIWRASLSITAAMSEWKSLLDQVVTAGDLSSDSRKNIDLYLAGTSSPVGELAVQELVEQKAWQELDDRFFKTLAFGTGGLRGRTVGRIVTQAEQGAGGPLDRPEHPCAGTATMNFFNLKRAMLGMVTYLLKTWSGEGRPSIVIGHDTRHFSRDFAETCAKVCIDLGVDAYLFEGPRATPQISFAIREMRADAGVCLTASHNPAHDNGFKAYFSLGSQIVEPAASGIIGEVNALATENYQAKPEAEQGRLTVLAEEMDRTYMDRLRSVLLQPALLESDEKAKIVYTNLHGTGGVIIVPMLRELGFEVLTVPEQDEPDGRFPTVESPNPENAPALAMGVALAEKENADAVIGTDPDCDRMGVAVKNEAGEMELLTGNQIGSLIGWYRIKTMFDLGWLTESNRSRAVLIKTLVTTELQAKIAAKYGISMVNTLTGFKFIGEKLAKYEAAIPSDKKGDYRNLSEDQSRKIRLEYSKFFVFGGEESYGYLGSDFVRDKDGNASAVMFAELAAYATSQGTTIAGLRDEVWAEYGVHLELGKSIVMEGSAGAQKIAALVESYSSNPPTEIDGGKCTSVKDYAKGGFYDEEGDEIPAADMLFVELDDGRRFAVRPSGTEPKIKYYLFGEAAPGDVAEGKVKVTVALNSLWAAVEKDAHKRMG